MENKRISEVFGGEFLIRNFWLYWRTRDGKEADIPGPAFVRNLLMKELDKTQIGALLREFKLVGGE